MSIFTKAFHLTSLARNMRESANRKHALRKARRIERAIENGETSEVFTTLPPPTDTELEDKGFFDPLNDYVGYTDNYEMVTNGHDGSTLSEGAPGEGKTSQITLPSIVHNYHRNSLIITDVDHECVRTTADFLESEGVKVDILNPSRAYNISDAGCNPLLSIKRLILAGEIEKGHKKCASYAEILQPRNINLIEDKKDWIGKGARELAATGMFTECDSADFPLFSNIYNQFSKGMEEALGWIYSNTTDPTVITRAGRFENELNSGADKQAHWQCDAAADAFALFREGTALCESTSRHGVDFSKYKKGKYAAYICLESDDLKAYGAWVSIITAYALDEIAAATGNRPVLVLADEFANIPPIPDILRSVLTLRKRGLKFHFLIQSMKALVLRYGRETAEALGDACTVRRWLSVKDDKEAERLSKWSGTKTVLVKSSSTTQQMDSSSNVSASEQSQPRMRIGDIIGLPETEQIVRLGNLPLMILQRAPWWEVEPWNDGRIKDLRALPDNRHEQASLKPLYQRHGVHDD